jgi:class 3 adenylate cyclase
MKRKIAAILAADIVGYSRLVAEDEEDTLTRLDSYRRVYEDFVTRAGGRIFNTAGDSVLAEFSSAVEATRCAIDIQESIRTRNLGYPASRQMLFRMGLTIGDVVEREGDLLGDGVNIAARLEGLAVPGGICVSQSVFEQVANKLSVPFRDMGEQEVKNIPQPVHAFMVELRGEGIKANGRPARPSAAYSQQAQNRKAGYALAAGALALLLGLGTLATVIWRDFRPMPPEPVQPRVVKVVPPKVADQPAAAKGTKLPGQTDLSDQSKSGDPARPSDQARTPDRAQASNQDKSSKQATPDGLPGPDEKVRATDGAKTTDTTKSEPVKPAGDAGSEAVKEAARPPGKEATREIAREVAREIVKQQAKTVVEKKPVKPPAGFPPGATASQIFSILAKNGGIVRDAKTVPELYHNAHVWEMRGQSADARTAYDKLAHMRVEAIDAHMRYAAILRAQDGRAGAREVYATLGNSGGGRVAGLVHAMQFAGAARREISRLRAGTIAAGPRICRWRARHPDHFRQAPPVRGIQTVPQG